MKKKTEKVTTFLEDLHNHIVGNPQFRHDTRTKSESQVQTEIRPLIISYLEKYFGKAGYKDTEAKAIKSFYWEGQEGKYGKDRSATFGSRNYPDFIIMEPYLVAVEYKQSEYGSNVKHGIGQSLMHTLCEEFHYVYFLFHDQNKDKRIEKSINNEKETYIINKIWDGFNVMIKFV
ncbi:MAG: hypothetical protein SVR94_15115 [Pseudomonadota bacterium]|nr:hypothetical protein [Pseudomonadota bacterium]